MQICLTLSNEFILIPLFANNDLYESIIELSRSLVLDKIHTLQIKDDLMSFNELHLIARYNFNQPFRINYSPHYL